MKISTRLILITTIAFVAISLVISNAVAVNTRISEVSARSAVKVGEDLFLSPNKALYDQLKIKMLNNIIKEGWFYIREHVQYDVDDLTKEEINSGLVPLVNS